jgi:lipid II:glycine glycyltransferase (peptidoglycan interpeptide bridge formation enzyme)
MFLLYLKVFYALLKKKKKKLFYAIKTILYFELFVNNFNQSMDTLDKILTSVLNFEF